MIGGSLLEVLSVAVALPYLQLLNSPDQALADLARWNIRIPFCETRERLLVAGTTAVVVFFAVKSVLVMQMWGTVYRFLYGAASAQSQFLFVHYLKRPYEAHLQSRPSELTRTLADDVPTTFMTYLYACMSLTSDFVVGLGMLSLLFAMAPLASLASLGILGGGCALFVRHIRHELGRAGRVHVTERANVLRWISQGLGGIKEIQIWQTADMVGNQLGEGYRRWSEAQRIEILLRMVPRTFGEPLLLLGALICVVVLVCTTADFSAFLPTLALFALASFRILPLLSSVTNAVNKLRFHYPAARRAVDELHVATTERAADRPAGSEAETAPAMRFLQSLELQRIEYRYPAAESPVLVDFSLTVKPREAVAIMGRSGSGKTTLVNLILGLLEPTHGEIVVDGASIRENLPGWRSLLAYIPQDVYLFEDSIRSNVRMGHDPIDPHDERVWSALEQAQLADFVRALPNGLDTPVSDRGANLSGGQRQRLGIARALYRDPAVLVFDEATSALDRETEAQLTAAIRQLVGKKTILLITHRPETAHFCDRTVLLDRGRLVADGSRNDVELATKSMRNGVESVVTKNLSENPVGVSNPPQE